MGRLITRLRELEIATRPEHPDLTAALAARWAELPAHVKQPNQMLGRRMTGCEGTHGVFPRCNLACTPCYHAKEANRVRTDGDHTEREVDRQMALLRALRGPGQHAQLIGGEVTLLGAEDHARALQAMLRHGRKPMSMTHGDFDYDYLERARARPADRPAALRPPRLRRPLRLAHVRPPRPAGRRATRPSCTPTASASARCSTACEREHGVTSYLAHNMTVTPRNLDEIPRVVRATRDMGFRMLSFQPAAYIGNEARWKDDLRAFDTDEVWRRIEQGAGARLHFNAEQVGDVRCNRTAHGLYVGDRYATLLDEDDPRDARALHGLHRRLRRHGLRGRQPPACARSAAPARSPATPRSCAAARAWALRLLHRARRRARDPPRTARAR